MTLTAPALWAGAVAVICVPLLTVKVVAGVPPNDTPVAPLRLVPVRTTEVVPAIGPEAGARLVTVGTAVMHETAIEALWVPVPL